MFPIKSGEKAPPLIEDWPNRATTDRDEIHAWWKRWPNANIGIATGGLSGLLVVDVDDTPGLNNLEAEHGALPATRTHSTPRGGAHRLFRYPVGEEIRNSASNIARGVDVRGEGGYIVAPPSRHSGRAYELLDDNPLAEPPAWLLEKLRRHPKGPRGNSGGRSGVVGGVAGPPIHKGVRNDALASIAGKLHDGTRTLEALIADLLLANEGRCAPPLPTAEVERIARSIYARYSPCTPSTAATPEALEELERFEAALLPKPFPGMAGKGERDTVIALIKLARAHGTLTPVGVRVSVGVRELAVLAGVSKKSLTRKGGILARLKAAGVIRSDNAGRRATEAGAFVLLTEATRAKGTHSPIGCEHLKNTVAACGYPLRAPRLRWGSPGVKRLGKTRGAVLDVLEAAGGSLSFEGLAAALHHKRPRDLRRRVLPPLESHGMVECSGDTVRLTPDYLEALERRREATGEIAAETRDRERNGRKSAERRERLAGREIRIPPSEAERAAVDELREIAEGVGVRRSFRAQRRAMRDVRHLERVPDLNGRVGSRVLTPRGVGELWDHKGSEARVVLDADKSRWIPVDVADVEILEVVA